MFYKTQIKSVTNDGVLDIQGKSLKFIGYLRVKPGDTVFTDGKFIFGNVPPKGTPAIFDEPSGIPVLGDKDSSGSEELQGYFNRNGKYRKYKVAGDKWIVNDKKTYAHDNGEENIIDAEIARDSNGKEIGVYTVEKVITQLKQNDEDYHWGSYYITRDDPTEEYCNQYGVFVGTVVQLEQDDFSDLWTFKNYPDSMRHVETEVYCSYEEGYTFMHQMGKCMYILRGNELDYRMADDSIIKKCEVVVRLDSKEIKRIDIADLLKNFEEDAKKETNPLPSRDAVKHIKTRANLCNFKISPDGTWEALIDAEIWAANSVYTQCLEDDNSSYARDIFSSTSHSRLLVKIKSDGTFEKFFEWKWIRPLIITDVSFGGYYSVVPGTHKYEEPDVSETAQGYILTSKNHEKSYTQGIYFIRIFTTYDARKIEPELKYNQKNLEIAENTAFQIQDDYQAEIVNVSEDIDKWKLCGVYDDTGNKIFGEVSADTDAHKWNMSIAPLKDGYLFGIHKDEEEEISGKLYLKDNTGKVEQVGGGLKNFRLRELKRISKARK